MIKLPANTMGFVTPPFLVLINSFLILLLNASSLIQPIFPPFLDVSEILKLKQHQRILYFYCI